MTSPPSPHRSQAAISITSLPTELLRVIFESIDSQIDLSRVSRTCRLWNATVKPALFAHPEITTQRALQTFLELLKSDSEAGEYVRDFELDDLMGETGLLSTTDLSLPEECLKVLCTSCPKIQQLKLQPVNDISGFTFPDIAVHLPNLHTLALHFDCWRRNTCMQLVTGCRALRSLSLREVPLTHEDLLEISVNCPHLRDVQFRFMHVNNSGVQLLIQSAPNLRHLELIGCHNVDEDKLWASKPDYLAIVIRNDNDASESSEPDYRDDEHDDVDYDSDDEIFLAKAERWDEVSYDEDEEMTEWYGSLDQSDE
ncbi:hypothetical protein DFJ77DRAFT_66477 [Powellomyces hirtus]|nr:hypothetical protein DFJ77DRAFT_66477 [Powellomyces hirtus]